MLKIDQEQKRMLAGILANVGNISIASVALPFIIPEFNQDQLMAIIAGLLLAVILWTSSILLVKKDLNTL